MHSSKTVTSSRVVFFQVRDNTSKLLRLGQVTRAHFEKKEAILILVEDMKAQTFVDEFLWKMGFLPHMAIDEPTQEYIVITKTKKNVNSAKIAFNLCPTPLLIESHFRMIYEFEDLTTSAKKNFSSLRFDAYKQAGFLIESRE